MTDTVVVEGQVRLREGKKWKSRWVVLRKPSPVADCLCVLVYKERSERNKGHRERSQVTLGDICGLEMLQGYEGMNFALTLLCLTQTITLAFDGRENLLAWDSRIRYSLGEGTGVFVLVCTEGEQISFLFDCIARGISPNRTGFGLRPSLPDLSTHQSSVEDRITQEASELEKRLSMLSVCSRQSSSGDTRSISSSSSETSHSDASLGSRLAIWAEPTRYSTPSEPPVLPPGVMASRPSSQEHPGRGLHPPSKPPLPRGLQEAGRQSSTDSGIATGSQSSYSGSFSSYTGSLDTTQGEVEEFGSAASLTLNPNTSLKLTSQTQNLSASSTIPSSSTGANLCVCPVLGAHEGPESEYQVPSQLLQHYDSPSRLRPLQPSTSSKKAAPKMTVPMMEYVVVLPADVSMPQQTVCSVCGGLKVTSLTPTHGPPAPAGLDEAKPEMSKTALSPASQRPSVDVFAEPGEMSSYELMSSCTQQKLFWETEGASSSMPTSPRSSLMLFRHPSLSGGPLALLGESVGSPSDRLQVDLMNYVNPGSNPVSKRQLNYMELDLQEVLETANTIRGSSSTKYAQIDITATEAAQRVGARHAQGREERLHQLEQKRRGNLN